MSKLFKHILASLVVASTLAFSFTSCGSSSNTNNKNQAQQSSQSSKPHREVSPDRKPQSSSTPNSSNTSQTLYKDGEVVTLADGSKLKYNANGNHEILEKGDGVIIIFKNVTDDELNNLTPEQKTLVERQMKSDPNGFALIY